MIADTIAAMTTSPSSIAFSRVNYQRASGARSPSSRTADTTHFKTLR
jgi:hypothetical protein